MSAAPTSDLGAARLRGRLRITAILTVVGPGLLAGLSDDDPAGITTYSVLGSSYGYQLLWVLLLSTLALIVFHDLGARMGVITGQGLIGLIRDRYGPRPGAMALVILLAANLGTTCAELAGVAAGFELFGVSRHVSVPLAAVLISLVVLKGHFHQVERFLMAICAVFLAYVVAGFVAGPDWEQAFTGLLVPTMPLTSEAVFLVTATVGTTLAPWGLSFIQSYAADKRLTADNLNDERVDVVVGSLLTGIIGFFVIVTCAATLHARGLRIESASDAATALEPLAGANARTLFAVGLIGAAVLATAILPLSTAYSLTEFIGHEGALDDGFRRAPVFYGTYLAVAAVAVAIVLLPGVSLIPLLVLTQVLNAILLLPLLIFMYALGRDPDLMGEHRVRGRSAAAYLGTIVAVAACIVALLALNFA
jgi:NRAMP (natural resistance-associated macrophage protein)-like metal ion transporter